MGIVADFLGKELLESKLAYYRRAAEIAKDEFEDTATMRRLLNPKIYDGKERGLLPERESYLRNRCSQAELEYAAGTDCSKVCEIYSDAATSWEPVVECIDFDTPVIYERSAYGAQVKSYIEKYNAQLVPEPPGQGGWKTIRYKKKRRPVGLATEQALQAAILGGNWPMAKQMAARYEIDEPSEWKDTLGLLIAIINEDWQLAQKCMDTFTGKYPRTNDWIPEREELPRGLLAKDASLFAEGVRRTTVRYRGMWKINKWKKPQKSRRPWKMKKYATFEEKLADIREELIDYRWVSSPFALVYACLALRSGLITEAIADSDIWSEWVPYDLVYCSVNAV